MDEGEKRSKLFDADESAMEEMSPDFSSDAEPDVYKDGLAYDPMWGNALNKKSDYGDENEGRGRRVFGGKAKKVADNKNDKKKNAQDALKKNEEKASKNPNDDGRGGDKNASLGEKEDNVESDSQAGKFKNAVQGVEQLKKGDIKGGSSKLKKAGPLMAVLALFLGCAGFSFLGQLSMPFSLIAQIKEQFDSISVSQEMRTGSFLRYQMENGGTKNCIRAHFFKSDEFKLSKRMIRKLGVHGITVEEVDGVKVMKFKGKEIVADPALAENGRIYFKDAYNSDPEFAEAYFNGAKTWRGSIAAWFDTSMTNFLKKIGIDRNIWKDYKKLRNKTSSDGDAKSDFDTMRDVIRNEADSDSADGKVRNSKVDENANYDEDTGELTSVQGNKNKPTDDDVSFKRSDVQTDSSGKIKNTEAVEAKVAKIGGTIDSLKKISSVTGLATNLVCGAADFVAAVSGIIAAYEAVQIVKTTSAILEAIDKTMAGDTDSAPIHEVSQSLTQEVETTYTKTTDIDGNGHRTGEESITKKGSAMSANAIGALFSGTFVDPTDPSVASFNINTAVKSTYKGIAKILGMVEVTATSFAACSHARVAAAAAGAAIDVAEIVGCVATAAVTFGAALLGCIAGQIAEGTAITAAASLVISAVVSFLTPFVAHALIRNIATEVLGEDLGNALVSGSNMIFGQNHQYSGGGIATVPTLTTYYQAQDQVIADTARHERETHSPFDITSKYTFLGSLATQLVPLASKSGSLMGSLNSLGTLFSNSIASFTPKSSAVSAAIRAEAESEATKKYCPDIADIGGVSDAFCNPYFITDTSTLDIHPADVVNSISEKDLDADEEGNPVVVKDSNLAKYIVYCGQRSSPWGKADQNIMSQIAPSADDVMGTNIDAGSFTVSPLTAGIGALPVIGDVADIVDGEQKISNMGWITGASCVTGYEKGVEEVSTVSWSEEKKYQRFIEDQRLAEAMGITKTSAVTNFLSEYYEEHPLDTSAEGILARFSGLTKEKVVATLDTLELLEYVAEYEPAGLYPYLSNEESDVGISIEQNNTFGDLNLFTVRYEQYAYPSRKEAYVG